MAGKALNIKACGPLIESYYPPLKLSSGLTGKCTQSAITYTIYRCASFKCTKQK